MRLNSSRCAHGSFEFESECVCVCVNKAIEAAEATRMCLKYFIIEIVCFNWQYNIQISLWTWIYYTQTHIFSLSHSQHEHRTEWMCASSLICRCSLPIDSHATIESYCFCQFARTKSNYKTFWQTISANSPIAGKVRSISSWTLLSVLCKL